MIHAAYLMGVVVSKIKHLLEKMDPGSVLYDNLAVGSMSSGMSIHIPITLIKGTRKGPCLWVNGQVHGNELNGVVAAIRFGSALDPAYLAGSVVITPTANPLALDNRTKTAPQDMQDLDQTFPGNANGMITSRLASVLFEEIRNVANCLVSLHTMRPEYETKPYCVYKIFPDSTVSETQLLRMMSFFEPSVACCMDVGGAGELPGNIAGALDYQCLALNIPAFMVELGLSYYTPEHIDLAVTGLQRLAQYLGIVPAGTVSWPKSIRRVTRRQWVMNQRGGLFLTDCSAGQIVPANQSLGRVLDLHGQVVERVTLAKDGIVIGTRRDPVAHTGDRVAFIATQWDDYNLSDET